MLLPIGMTVPYPLVSSAGVSNAKCPVLNSSSYPLPPNWILSPVSSPSTNNFPLFQGNPRALHSPNYYPDSIVNCVVLDSAWNRNHIWFISSTQYPFPCVVDFDFKMSTGLDPGGCSPQDIFLSRTSDGARGQGQSHSQSLKQVNLQMNSLKGKNE